MPKDRPEPKEVKRPWGEELWISNAGPSMVKILSVNPGESLSLQYHNNRDEYWHILSGNGTAQIGLEIFDLKAGTDYFVPKGTTHRLNGGKEKLVLLELDFGKFDETDIVRLEDRYGRV